MKFAVTLGKINSVIILTLLFIVLVGVYALIRKSYVVFKNLFHRKSEEKSFWTDKKRRPATIDELRRQF